METPAPGLYNAPMNAATGINKALLQRYIDEGQIQNLLTLFEVQFDALRRAEALNMLYIQEIRNLKIAAERKLLGAEPSDGVLPRSKLHVTMPPGAAVPATRAQKASAPSKPKSTSLDIEL